MQQTNFGGIGDGGSVEVNLKGSVVQRSQIGSTRRCPNCDAEVQADEKLCTNCGAKVSEAELTR